MKIAVGGPPGAGKTTVSFLLSEWLNMPVCSLDNYRQKLYPKWGYSEEMAESIFQREGALALHQYESEYELRALEHTLTLEYSLIIDLSGGVLLQNCAANKRRLENALTAIDLLIFLLPAQSRPHKALSILQDRITIRDKGNGFVQQWLRFGGTDFLRKMVNVTLDSCKQFAAVCIDTEEPLEETILETLRMYFR